MAESIRRIAAKYTPYPVACYQGNPLIEALPCYAEYESNEILKML